LFSGDPAANFCLFTQYAIYLIGHAVYDLYFHPLSHFPGPKLLAISNLPFLSWWIGGTSVFKIRKLHGQYGGIVRTGPDQLSFRDPQAWKDIYGHRGQGQKNLVKDTRFYGEPHSGNDSLLASSDEDHTRQRRLVAHAFSERALREQEPLIGLYVDLLVEKLYGRVSGPSRGKVDMVKWYNFTTFDVIGDLSFGEPFNCLENNEYHSWVSAIFQGVKGSTLLVAAGYYPWISYLITNFLIPKHLIKMRRDNLALSAAKVDRRIALGTNRPDFISYILKHNETEKGMAKAEIESNANVLIGAGSETTATFLSGCTFYILKHRHVYDKLVHEIRSAFRTEADITFSALQTLPYLDAVVNETFRLYPPVAIGLPRIIPEGGAIVCDRFIPEGVRKLEY
jgi:cytochrome P450